jgi:hypothetical protein
MSTVRVNYEDVKSLSFTYKQFMGDDFNEVIVTEWPSGEGFDVVLNGRLGATAISLSHEDVAALVAALSLAVLPKLPLRDLAVCGMCRLLPVRHGGFEGRPRVVSEVSSHKTRSESWGVGYSPTTT